MSNQRPSGVVLCHVLAQGQHAAAMQPTFLRCGWFVGVAFSEIAAPVLHEGACGRFIVECKQDADGQARVEIRREYVEASEQGERRDSGDYLCCRSMRKRLVAQHCIDGWTVLNGTQTTGHGAAGECDELMRGRVEGTAGAGYDLWTRRREERW